MSDPQSGFIGNRYSYDPLKYDGPAANLAAALGGALGSAVGSAAGGANPVTSSALSVMGDGLGQAAGYSIGTAVDNQVQIAANVQAFISEMNDWRSYVSIMGLGNFLPDGLP